MISKIEFFKIKIIRRKTFLCTYLQILQIKQEYNINKTRNFNTHLIHTHTYTTNKNMFYIHAQNRTRTNTKNWRTSKENIFNIYTIFFAAKNNNGRLGARKTRLFTECFTFLTYRCQLSDQAMSNDDLFLFWFWSHSCVTMSISHCVDFRVVIAALKSTTGLCMKKTLHKRCSTFTIYHFFFSVFFVPYELLLLFPYEEFLDVLLFFFFASCFFCKLSPIFLREAAALDTAFDFLSMALKRYFKQATNKN